MRRWWTDCGEGGGTVRTRSLKLELLLLLTSSLSSSLPPSALSILLTILRNSAR